MEAGHEALIEPALAEDIGSGDVTTEARSHAGRRARARIEQKAHGCRIRAGGRGGDVPPPRPGLELARGAPRGRMARPAAGRLSSEMAGDARALLAARARGAQLPPAALGHRHRGPRRASSTSRDRRRCSTRARPRRGYASSKRQAVAAGGGQTTGWASYDAMLVKENHTAMAGGIGGGGAAGAGARRPGVSVEVECATLDDVAPRWTPARRICCSTTWTRARLREAVGRCGRRARRARGLGRHHAGQRCRRPRGLPALQFGVTWAT